MPTSLDCGLRKGTESSYSISPILNFHFFSNFYNAVNDGLIDNFVQAICKENKNIIWYGIESIQQEILCHLEYIFISYSRGTKKIYKIFITK